MKLKDFYLENYPTDEVGQEISETANFVGLQYTVVNGGDVYDYIGIADSVVRERLFEKLAESLNTSYDYVYDLWLK